MDSPPGSDVVNLPLILIGFSRGALVLNQLLSELGTSLYSDSVLLRCREVHWLDCGNGGNHLCFPVLSESALACLHLYRFVSWPCFQLSHSIRLCFHATPYLYQESASCSSYAQLLSLAEQLRTRGLAVWIHFYRDEFEWYSRFALISRKYGAVSTLQQHFSLLYEFHTLIVCNKHATARQTPRSRSPSPSDRPVLPLNALPRLLSHSSFSACVTSK